MFNILRIPASLANKGSMICQTIWGIVGDSVVEWKEYKFKNLIDMIEILIMIPKFQVQTTWMSQVLYSNGCSASPHLPLVRDMSELVASSVQAEEVRG